MYSQWKLLYQQPEQVLRYTSFIEIMVRCMQPLSSSGTHTIALAGQPLAGCKLQTAALSPLLVGHANQPLPALLACLCLAAGAHL